MATAHHVLLNDVLNQSRDGAAFDFGQDRKHGAALWADANVKVRAGG